MVTRGIKVKAFDHSLVMDNGIRTTSNIASITLPTKTENPKLAMTLGFRMVLVSILLPPSIVRAGVSCFASADS